MQIRQEKGRLEKNKPEKDRAGKNKTKENILIFCAHSDDEIIGMGGTIAKYIQEGKNIITVIFSAGEKSIPWLQEEYLAELRKKEADKVSKEVGKRIVLFLSLRDFEIKKQIEEKNIKQEIVSIIKKYSPSRIFTHSPDYHFDHRTVYKTITSIIDSLKTKYPLYTFDVWKMIDSPKNLPKMYINISDTFKIKIKALKQYKSQLIFSIYPLLPSVYFKAIFNGYKNKTRYAELFYKIR